MSVSDISYNLFHRNQSATRISNALTLLKNSKIARMETQLTAGRPAEMWYAM